MNKMYKTQLPATFATLASVEKSWNFKLAHALVAFEEFVPPNGDDEDGEYVFKTRPKKPILADQEPAMGVPVVPGLIMLTGATGLGKTQVAIDLGIALADRQLSVTWATLNEPALLSDAFNDVDDIAALLFAQTELSDVIIIDSFRLLQFSVAGTTRSGGVSSGLFEMLTELNNAAEQAGIILIGLFNPLAADAETAARFDSEIESSVQTVMKLTARTKATVVSRATGRQRRNVDLETSRISIDSSETPLATQVVAGPTASSLTQLIFNNSDKR